MAQMISKEESASEPIRGRCEEITSEVDRVTAQLNEFINFSKPPEVRRTSVDLGSIIEDVTRPLRGEMEDQKIVVAPPPHPFRIEADEKMLRQVVFNIILNSLQAMNDGGHIAITTGTAEDGAWIEIRDDGPGIAEAHREKIFQPYYTTREKEGSGLGLAIVRQIVLAHGWEIAFQPAEPRGTKFRITRIREAAA